MGAWRTLATVVGLLASVSVAEAQQKHALVEVVKPGDCFRIQVEMDLSGELRINQVGKPGALKLAAAARLEYPERVLHVSAANLPDRSARIYETARAAITVADSRSERALRPDRKLVVAQRYKDLPLVYCPTGPLTREEVELIGEHFDSLFLPGLLPGKEVAVSETWKPSNAVVQALCHFEGLTEQDLTCKLDKVEGQSAHVSVTGSATGIDSGALVKLKIQANYRFDLGTRRLVVIEWKQEDERDQGPVSPASKVQAKTVLKRTPIDQPQTLLPAALVGVPDTFEPSDPTVQLEYRSPQDRFELLYGREWFLVSQTEEHVVMRMLDRGDFVAQMTVTPWKRAEKGKHLAPDEFKEAMASTPGWVPQHELQAGTVPAEDGRWLYRISAVGLLDGVEVLQNFYLVAGPGGDQVVLVFTMPAKQADRLGSRDLAIAANIDFPASRKDKGPAKKP